MWTTLKEDVVLRGFLAYSALLLVPFLVPLLGVAKPAWLTAYSDTLFEVLLLPAVVVALQTGVGRIASSRERLFWHRVTASIVLWWLVQCLYLLPASLQGVALDLAADTVFFCFYVSFFLAAETYAHAREREPADPIRRVQTAGVFILLSGLAIYLVVIPVMLDRAAYHTWVPSIYMYMVFDAILAARFARLAEISADRRWRWIYVVLSVSLGFSMGLQFLLLLYFEDVFVWSSGSPLEILWWIPPLGFVAAARLRRHRFDEEEDSSGRREQARQTAKLSSPMVATALVLPIFHFAAYTFHLLEEELRGPRQGVVLATLAVMSVLAMREHAFRRRHSEVLEEQRRKAERATQKRTTFLNSLIDNSPLAIVVLDAEATVSISNPAFERLFQISPAEILGRELDELILADDVREEGRELTARILSGESLHVTTRRYRQDRTAVEVEFYGVPLMVEDELIGIYAIYQDITERMVAERAQRESEERFRRLADATFEGIVIVEGGRVLDANEQYARMLGATPAELEGRLLTDFVAPEDHELVEERLREGYERPYEHRARRLDGSIFHVEVLGRSMPHEGRTVRVTAVRDVTEHKRLEEEARQAQKMEAVGRLAGGIAHDFNNLLTVILGHCSILSNRFKATSPSRSHVEEIRRAAGQATMMTQRLLAFGRKQPRQAEVIDLSKVIHGMEKMLRRLVRADIDLTFNLSPRLGRVRADAGQIEQVVLNLVINAADAMPDGGTVTLGTSSTDLDDTGPHWSLDGSTGAQVQLEVSDTGTGMDAETRARAFEPFFTTKEKGKGTGLGLSTVYGIVRQNGGSILVDSAPGHGTSFRIFLPQVLDLPKTPEAESEPAETADLQGSESILVVEDEAAVRRLAIDFLEIHGYKVLEAEDGDQGLRMVQESNETIDMILTDVVMPGMNGPEMAERIAELRPGIKILFMTGYDDGILEQSRAGDARMVQKPFSIDDLLGQVREVLDAA